MFKQVTVNWLHKRKKYYCFDRLQCKVCDI